MPSFDPRFTPDFSPSQLRDLGVFDMLYKQQGPRLASQKEWKPEWINPQDPHGWLQWYDRYTNGRRTDDDDRQVKRWASFKARHGGSLAKNPTPRRAFALRNWGIDALKLIDNDKKLALSDDMHNYETDKKREHDKQADYAKGIPDRGDYGDLSQLPVGQLVDYITQRHVADRAGLHTDLRFGTPDTGLYSWAVRKGMPSPGAKHLAVIQPVHSHEYKDFEGEIPSGYGKGTVKRDDEGKVLITKVEPGKVHLTVAHRRYPERYVLVKPDKQLGNDKNWLLMNTTPTKPIPYEKAHYKSIPSEKVEDVIKNLEPNSSVQAKIDGAASLTQLLKDKIELLSYRKSKVHGGPIIHTERAFSTVPNVNIPKEYQGSILRGELYGQQHGNKPVAPQLLGGLLNSSIAKSLPAQQQNDIKLKNMVFDIEQMGKKPISRDVPYAERMAMTKQVLAAITGKDEQLVKDRYHTPEEYKTPEEAMKLYQDIKGGLHPATEEGIVIHPPTGIPMKSKLTNEYKTYIRGIVPGKNKWTDRGAGAFVYSHEPDGPIAGEVGTGMTDQLRQDMFNNPNDYVGRQARVRSTRKLPSGALFQPSLLGMYEG